MKIGIVDDQPLIRLALDRMARDVSSEAEFVEAHDFPSALGMFAAHRDIGLVLIGLSILQPNDAAALDVIRAIAPDVPIAILTAADDPPAVRRLRDRGVLDVLHKNQDSGEIRAAVGRLLLGAPWRAHRDRMPPIAASQKSILTARQSDVLALLAAGLTNLAIARTLGLAENTVRVHVSAILQCLNVANRVQAVNEGRRRGLLPPEEEERPALRA